MKGRRAGVFAVFVVLALVRIEAAAQPPWAGQGGGPGQGPRGGRGPRADAAQAADRELFHFLLDHRASIRRTVKMLPDGVETVTESDDPEVVEKIRTHVQSMYGRLKEGRPIHMRDPLFAEIFRHAARIEMQHEDTEKGVRVRETSSDPYVVKLIQEHAEVVSLFLKNGHEEVRKNHPPPARPQENAPQSVTPAGATDND